MARPSVRPLQSADVDAHDLLARLGLELQPAHGGDQGGVFLAGDVGPFAPYLPSGAYL